MNVVSNFHVVPLKNGLPAPQMLDPMLIPKQGDIYLTKRTDQSDGYDGWIYTSSDEWSADLASSWAMVDSTTGYDEEEELRKSRVDKIRKYFDERRFPEWTELFDGEATI